MFNPETMLTKTLCKYHPDKIHHPIALIGMNEAQFSTIIFFYDISLPITLSLSISLNDTLHCHIGLTCSRLVLYMAAVVVVHLNTGGSYEAIPSPLPMPQ